MASEGGMEVGGSRKLQVGSLGYIGLLSGFFFGI